MRGKVARPSGGLQRLVIPVLVLGGLSVAAHFLFDSWVGWSAPERGAYPAWIANGLPFLQFMAVAFALDRLFRILAEGLRGASGAGRGMPKLALQLVSAVIYFAFLGASVGVVFGESVGGVLAASGIVGLAVGFALRGLLADVFSGIALHLDTGIRSGQWLDVSLRGQQYCGRLVDIQWRTVVLADRLGNLVFIPNSEFATASVVNRSQPEPGTEYGANLAVSGQYDCGRVRQILLNALDCAVQGGILLAQPAPGVSLTGMDPSGSVSYRLFYSIDPSRVSPTKAQTVVLGHALDFLRAANIQLGPVLHHEYSRPAAPGGHRFTQAEARLAALANVKLLGVLSQPELAELARRSSVMVLGDGQQVMRAGEEGESMVVVAEGRLAVMVEGQRVATLWPGECAGEMSLLTGSPRSADVVAEGGACLLEVPKAALTPILHANPQLVERIAEAVAKRKAAGQASQAQAEQERDEETGTLISKIRRFFLLGG